MVADNCLAKCMLLLLIFNTTSAISFNQPKLGPNAAWNSTATTIANQSVVGDYPRGIFVNSNNTLFVATRHKRQILIWSERSTNPQLINDISLFESTTLFVATDGNIYFESEQQGRIVKLEPGSQSNVQPVTEFHELCHGLFINIQNTLYCSVLNSDKVIANSLKTGTTSGTFATVAGTGSPGSEPDQLRHPHGIFVDTNLTLYVADSDNHRIQRFRHGQANGTTVAGNGIPSDYGNHRIIRASATFHRCIAGCSKQSGPASDQLNNSYSIRFDSYGNLYVADESNHRIQKFHLLTNSDESSTSAVYMNTPTTANPLITTLHDDLTTSQQTSPTLTAAAVAQTLTSVLSTMQKTTALSSFVSPKQSASTTTEKESAASTKVPETSTDAMTTTQQPKSSSAGGPKSSEKPSNDVDSVTTKQTNGIWSTTKDWQTTMIRGTTLTMNNDLQQSSHSFIPESCNHSTNMTPTCHALRNPCILHTPCKHNDSCNLNNTAPNNYSCSCPIGFNGTHCEHDHRRCKTDTCLNNGICNETLNATSPCSCKSGWEGDRCQAKVNFCWNITCHNRGVCRPIFLNYTCECLGDSYSGRHCEIVAAKIILRVVISRSCAYIAIIALITVALFIVIMDILKYGFGIDPVHEERERLRREKRKKQHKPVIQRFICVNAPPSAIDTSTNANAETIV